SCVICGRSAKDGTTLHIDHIIPLANNGSNDISNLQVLCAECNFGKKTKEM
ncbi:MAG: HNH endonuclease, partial [Bacteroidetes bacterium]|nr:HNH endonuclease [Bacteroidota bacterium]